MANEEAHVQFRIRREQHKKLFRWLDKNAPGWGLALRPENELYQMLCDNEGLEEPDELRDYLKNKTWAHSRAKLRCYPVIWTTKKYGTIMRMFWPDRSRMTEDDKTAEIFCWVYRLPGEL